MTMTPAIDNAALARRFLPSRWSPDRYHYYYARSKLATDPVYGGVLQALDGCDAPLLDLGCGIGLLAHYLRAAGRSMPYVGVDVDAGKIAVAERGLRNQPLEDVRFAVRDVGRDVIETDVNVIAANTTAAAGRTYDCDTSAGAFTLTLPAAPAIGARVGVRDYKRSFGKNNLTLARNTQLIEGLTESCVIDRPLRCVLEFRGGSQGWLFI